MEFIKGKLTIIKPSGDIRVEDWSGSKVIISSPFFESGKLAKEHMSHDPNNFHKNAFTRNILLHRGN